MNVKSLPPPLKHEGEIKQFKNLCGEEAKEQRVGD